VYGVAFWPSPYVNITVNVDGTYRHAHF